MQTLAGSDAIDRAQLEQVQRERVLAALARVAARGGGHLTVSDVVSEARLSRRTFYELFDGCDEALLAASERALAEARRRVIPPYLAAGAWQQRVRAALEELLAFCEERPYAARLLLAEPPPRGALALRHRELCDRIAVVLHEDGARRSRTPPSPVIAEAVLGGVLATLRRHAWELGPDPRLGAWMELANDLMSLIVLPYLGLAAARRELRVGPRRVAADTAANGSAALDDGRAIELPMRVTYRTLCVLAAVAERPGASNKALAAAAGVGDQGQMSKLLTRLERLGLIVCHARGQGLANRWRLTALGEQLLATTRSPDLDEAAPPAPGERRPAAS